MVKKHDAIPHHFHATCQMEKDSPETLGITSTFGDSAPHDLNAVPTQKAECPIRSAAGCEGVEVEVVVWCNKSGFHAGDQSSHPVKDL